MSNDNHHDQRDLRAARRLGAWLRGDEHALERENGLFEALFAYRSAALRAFEPTAEQSERMWMRIAREVDASSAPPRARIFHLHRWQAAAAVAAAVLLGGLLLFLLTRSPEAELLAEAGTTTLTHTTDDGSTVTLRPHSALYSIEAGEEGATRYRLEGEGLFDVARNEERAVEVEAREGLVTVLGTRFSVKTWREDVEVVLFEGSVRFEHVPTGRDLVLAPGQRAGLSAGGQFEETALETPELDLGWLDSELVFEERPLSEVLAELEYHHGIEIDVPEEVQNQTLTGRILLDDPQQSLDDLGLVMGGRFERVDDRTYRFVGQ